MTQEEKAKAYDEALEQAKKELAACGSMDCDAARLIFRLFPQLRESEDERIRKGLIEALKASKTVGELKFVLPYPTREECIAYLEKQKEQKPTETKQNPLVRMVEDKKAITEDIRNGISTKTIEKKRNVKFATPVDVSHAEWSEEHIADVFEKVGLAKIVREQGNDELTNAVQSAMLELSKGYQQEWSEEDEDILDAVIELVTHTLYEPLVPRSKLIAWLKSLRPQKKEDLPKWKPSEEHLSALLAVFNDPNNIGSQTCQFALTDLYNDLKKLKED